MVDPLLQASFLDVMARVATPVSIVTAMLADRPHGTTVSAFTSLSLDPPMVVIALDRGSDLLPLVHETRRFGVNVLGSTQSALALAFARKGGAAKFEGTGWHTDSGLPRLPQTPGWLVCDVVDLVPGGDHVLALGAVVMADALSGDPLTYHGRAFGTHAALEQLS